ncbi:hypothetical protein [Alloacidobacterium sp.]|uniref:hypothetical protein n=1 Tax=Alloacidobacterium sp. TaxID=2951999 RepID=UPI002D3EC3FE|nr:hypothetical protein [Alloacidobacterium sp.]HYK37789.1 hypothetical protein [Alloacidobacterium sp.]
MKAARWVILTGILFCGVLRAQENNLVKIVSAIQRGTNTHPIFDIRLSYAFESRETVWLEGIGVVPGSGDIQYTLRARQVVFLDKRKGQLLSFVPVRPTEVHQTPVLDDPYPSCVQLKGWQRYGDPKNPIMAPVAAKGAWSFMENALGQTFEHHDLNPTVCSPRDGGSLVTQWTQIVQPENWIEGQIAVLVFYGSGTSTPALTSLEIYYAAAGTPG